MINKYIKNDKFISESHLEQFIINNIEYIEEGMRFISRQVKMGNGFIDIFASDKNGKVCVVELKNTGTDKRLSKQCKKYYKELDGLGRVIVLAPYYSLENRELLRNVDNIELKKFSIREGGLQVVDVDLNSTTEEQKVDIIIKREYSSRKTNQNNGIDNNSKNIEREIPSEKALTNLCRYFFKTSVLR